MALAVKSTASAIENRTLKAYIISREISGEHRDRLRHCLARRPGGARAPLQWTHSGAVAPRSAARLARARGPSPGRGTAGLLPLDAARPSRDHPPTATRRELLFGAARRPRALPAGMATLACDRVRLAGIGGRRGMSRLGCFCLNSDVSISSSYSLEPWGNGSDFADEAHRAPFRFALRRGAGRGRPCRLCRAAVAADRL